ncbi:carboxylic acid reductase [Kutzneria sp. CA-103260]|uniref:carboxylic acid reductase n=1 Tax=Kutzneria sp. CA-103260 TaxID=2802641 RepID=UPI001BF0540E|nr:carboxylic acid reductase [Kutzneria sp. CA-103260]QUQ64251.1 NAD-dependent epimerase/dehydratase family protein [Kutzneria sp. CA-103260]
MATDTADLSRPSTSWAEQLTAELMANDEQLRALRPRDQVTAAMHRPGLRLAQVVAEAMTGYADRPALAERATELVTDPLTGRATRRLLPRFETTTYGELWSRVRAVAAAWRHHPTDPLRAGDFVATLGFTSADYTTVDLACVHEGLVSVPLPAGSSAARLRPILDETAVSILATSVDQLPVAVEAAVAGEHVRQVLVFDHHAVVDDHRDAVRAARQRLAAADRVIVLETLTEVIERGDRLPAVEPHVPQPGEDPLTTLVYTSGSTGTPKGAMYPESLVRGHWLRFRPGSADLAVVRLNYLPMSHLTGRTWLLETFTAGGVNHFAARADLSTLFEDIGLARPVDLFFIPRLCDLLWQHHRDTDPAEIRGTLLGGRIVRAAFGSAPLAPEMGAFVESCLGVRLHNGYGSTEAGAVVVDGRVARPLVLDYKLVDVPELGYFGTDQPHPRGELLVRTRSMIPGYFRRPELNTEVFDADGFFRTGDIMAETGPDQLRYLDRRSSVIKLSQGEFVAVSRLELLYATSPLVDQLFLYGNSERAHLLAVVVPAESSSGDILASLREIAREHGLNAYEIPRDVVVATEPFSVANGLLSDMRKPLRPRLAERYGPQLEQLYEELAAREDSELAALRAAGPDQLVFPAVCRAARALLAGDQPLTSRTRFTDLGGDSLAALTFATTLTDVFQTPVPVAAVLDPTGDLGQLAQLIEAAATRPTVASVHGPDVTSVRAADLTLDKFIDPEILDAASTLPRVDGEPRTVLLTGATGFLGRFLCLEWLERLSANGGRLICLVRGDAARLTAVFDSDPESAARFQRLLGSAEIVTGDVGAPDLGLAPQEWRRLAETVDLIVHPAALVNHVLPYDQLFGPNVVGAAEVIRLALTARRKPVDFVSTAAVADGQPVPPEEDGDIRVTSPARELNSAYANGYATSKWAAEVLLREAHDRCGLPVTVFRSGLILAHSRYAGQLNVPDVFTRLVLSLLATGIAPDSFYSGDGGHFDGLPVDFTARAITALSTRTTGHRTFHVLNPHEDGISLDTVVDWLSAGRPIRRIPDFAEWTVRFEAALRGLPDRVAHQSLLPLRQAFAEPAAPTPGSGLPADRFHEAVLAAGIGDIPPLSADLIAKYVTDLGSLLR